MPLLTHNRQESKGETKTLMRRVAWKNVDFRSDILFVFGIKKRNRHKENPIRNKFDVRYTRIHKAKFQEVKSKMTYQRKSKAT